jgi:uncharacterized protein YxjI
MTTKERYNISNLSLEDSEYEVKQSLVRNKYKVRDRNGEVVLKGKQKMFKMKEEFPFVNGDGEEVFTVKAGKVLDVAGNYSLVDSETGEEVVVLDEDLSFLVENWTIRDPNTEEELATIKSKNKILSALRHLSDIANFVPNEYEIFDSNGQKVGEISGEFSLKDTYNVSIDKSSDVPREAVMASACILDALENK